MKPTARLRSFLLASSALLAAPLAHATTLYWDGTSASWNTVGNWSTASGATTPDPLALSGILDDLIFNITTANGAESITLDAHQSANSLTFNNTGTTTLLGGTARTLNLGTGGITIGASAGAVTLGDGTAGNNVLIKLATGAQTWTNNSANNFTINNSDASFATRAAGQTLAFNQVGAGVFSMSTTVLPNDATRSIIGQWALFGSGTGLQYAVNNAGTIGGFAGSGAADANAFTTATTNYDFSTTGTTTLTGSRTANTIRYTGTGNTIDLGAAGANTLTLNGILAVGASGTLTIQRTGGTGTVVIGNLNELVVAGPQAVTISAPVSGGGALTYSGTNTLTLSSSANTYTGATFVNSGTLKISGSGRLNNGSYAGAVNIASGAIFEYNSSATQTISGLLGGSGTLLKSGSGTLTLSGATTAQSPTFSGTIQITAGKIALPQVALGGTLGNSAVSLWTSVYDTTGTNAVGVGIDLSSASNTLVLGGLAGNENISNAIEGNWSTVPKLILNPQQGVSVSYSGIISNGAAGMTLNKIGRGTQTLTGTNTYSGATTVWAGTLALADALGTAQSSAFTVRGGTLLLDNSTAWADRLNNTTALSLGSLTLTSSNGAGAQTETVGTTTFAVGGKVTINNGATGGDQTTLALSTGNVVRTVGAAIDFVGTNGTLGGGANSPNVTTIGFAASAAEVNGILHWATVGGTQWAEDDANSIRAYSGSFFDINSSTNAQNAQISGVGLLSGARVANSLNIIATASGQGLNLGVNNLTLGSAVSSPGAILKSGADAYTIGGTGQVRAGSAGAGTELIAHVDGGALTISAPLATAINSIAKGGTGDLILSGTRSTNFTNAGFISIAGGQLEFQGLSTTVNSLVTGSGGLTVNLNAGQTLVLGNNGNTYTGQTIVKGGYLTFNSYNNIGLPGGFTGGSWLGSSNTSLAASNLKLDGGVLYATYTFDKDLGDGPNQIQITGGTSGFVNTANSGGAAGFELDNGKELVWGSTYFNPSVFVFSQNVGANLISTLANGIDLNGSTRTILVGDATYNTIAFGGGSQIGGAIRTSSGTAGLTKTGIGKLILSGTNTYNGTTTVDQGILQPNTISSLPGYNSAGKVVFNGGTLATTIGGSNWTTGQVDTLLSNATKTSGQLGIDTTNGNLTQWTPFTTTNLGSTLGLNKFGANTLILDKANTYTGGTTVTEGTLALVGSLSASSVSVTRAAIFVQAASGAISGTGATFTQGSTGASFLSGTNTYTGGTTISAGALAFAKTASMPASGAVAVQTGATIGIGLGGTGEWTTGTSGNGTLGGLLGGLGGQSGSTVTYSGAVGINLITTGSQSYGVIGNVSGSSSTGLVMSGTGTLTLNGTNTYTGATTLNAGTLKLNYGAGGSDTTKFANGAALNLNGGTLELSGGSHLEAVSATTLTSGTTFITQTNSGTAKLSMGGIGFSSGAIDFSAPSIATTSTGVTNGILSQRATVAGANFAMKSGSDIVAYNYVTSGSTGYTGAAMVANTNYELTASGASTLAGTTGATTNTLKIANASSGSLAVGANTLTVGAILFSGSANYDITTSGAGKVTPSILHNYGTGGAVLNLGALGGVLTQYGTGKTILTSTAQNAAGLNIFGGTVQVSSNAQIGTPSSGATIALNNGTLLASETLALNNAGANHRAITIGAQGGTLAAAATKTLTVSGVISGLGNPLTIGSASSTGTVSLTGANIYANATEVIGGALSVSGSIGLSSVSVSNSGTVLASGATGTIGNTVAINNGAILAAGGNGAAGTATALGATTFNNGSIFSWDISANGASFDKLIAPSLVDGDATGGSVFRIVVADATFADAFWSTAQSWTNIFTTDGSAAIADWADIFTTVSVVESDLTTAATLPIGYSFTISGNTLSYSAIPEPTSALAGLLLGAGLLRRRRQGCDGQGRRRTA